ncbi:zinc finger protein 836-like [Metopolophium dirhodum]|uniref:zinc finger protein 836-like n=1 Tax=Metopolophium dirhodum TaxID=44670 RepID=UPI00298FA82E|nr:zinc finger protein 836-like [Metopolophium dirhodum]
MTSMKDYLQVEVTGDADAVTSDLYVENTIENPALYTIENNHVSLVSENVEKCIELETEILDDCMWESRIKFTKDVANQSNMELPLEYQDVTDNIYLNPGNTSDKLFHCNICGESFVLNYLLKNHLADHKGQVHYKTNKCKFCGKLFKLKFGLNRHIQKHHNSMYNCKFCGLFIDCSKFIEHKKYHERRDSIGSIVRDTPYFCIRKSPNIENGLCTDDYGQTSQNKLIFTCRICKNPPSTDIHSFALHMSNHRECNMHECIVCDKTFNSVVLWTAHMTYHQQQIDLNVSTVQFNLFETESNTFDPINSRNMEPQVFTNLKDTKCKTTSNTDSVTMSRNQKKETKSSSTKKTNFCNLCNRKFTKQCYFANHMIMKHNINANTQKQLTSIDCNESIILSENIELTNEYENKLSAPVNNKNNNLINRVNKSNKKKSTFCVFCNKHFAHLGALTNHMRIHVEHPCDVCEKKFSTPFQLNVHRKSHSKLKIESISHKDKIKCRHCKKECNSISQWKNHMSMSKECRRHCKSYLPEFTSNNTVLDKTYLNTYDNIGSQKDKLMDKIQQKPAVKKRNRSNHINDVKCELCGKIYCNEYNLIRHISMIHKQTYKPVNCNVCGITLKNKFSYGAHLRSVHKQFVKHHEGTNSTYQRTGGQNISVNKKNIMKYICKICNMKFADNITLQNHAKRHTLNMYKCNACGQQYETNLALGNHIWENHSDV